MAQPGISTKIPKKYCLARNSGAPEFAPKLPVLGYVFWYFGGIFLGLQISAWGYFFGNLMEIPGRAILGLCSRSVRSCGECLVYWYPRKTRRNSHTFLEFSEIAPEIPLEDRERLGPAKTYIVRGTLADL